MKKLSSSFHLQCLRRPSLQAIACERLRMIGAVAPQPLVANAPAARRDWITFRRAPSPTAAFQWHLVHLASPLDLSAGTA